MRRRRRRRQHLASIDFELRWQHHREWPRHLRRWPVDEHVRADLVWALSQWSQNRAGSPPPDRRATPLEKKKGLASTPDEGTAKTELPPYGSSRRKRQLNVESNMNTGRPDSPPQRDQSPKMDGHGPSLCKTNLTDGPPITVARHAS